jgi:hypothetical protein
VLGADNGRAGGRKMLQTPDHGPEDPADGLAHQPAAEEIEVGGERTGHSRWKFGSNSV